ncbi:uncharacterized protein BDV17DRAFT_19293 [Aspergillus undulatus]|uniref:uncharacterized protein n=1 Tax=Aspergillus undulatus TaxID=1810928 RepID=UPI003CCE172B
MPGYCPLVIYLLLIFPCVVLACPSSAVNMKYFICNCNEDGYGAQCEIRIIQVVSGDLLSYMSCTLNRFTSSLYPTATFFNQP